MRQSVFSVLVPFILSVTFICCQARLPGAKVPVEAKASTSMNTSTGKVSANKMVRTDSSAQKLDKFLGNTSQDEPMVR